MDKIRFIGVLTYTVICYIIFSSIVWLAQAGINCSNLTSVCPNRPVILTCKAPHLPVQWQHRDSIPKLFKDITLRGNSVEGHKEYYDGFVATVVKKNKKFVLTSLEFSPNSSYERGNIRCEYYKKSTNEKCTIRYEYLKSPLAPIDFKNDSNRYGIVTLSWKLNHNSVVEHAYLSIHPPSNDDTHLGKTYIVDGRNSYTVTGIRADSTYTIFLRVENCMGSNETNITLKTESYSPTTPEFDACTVLHSNKSNKTTTNAEINWQCASQDQIPKYYKVRVIGNNNELIHQEHFATSCGKSYFVLPYEGMFTVEVSALNVYGESQPKSKKLIYSPSFLKVEDFDNLTVQCCVEDVKNLSSNANCTIIIKEGEVNETRQFGHQKCVHFTIPEKLHSYEAYIDGDPDICYRINKNNGTVGVMEPKDYDTSDKITIGIIAGSVLLVFFLFENFMIIKHYYFKLLPFFRIILERIQNYIAEKLEFLHYLF